MDGLQQIPGSMGMMEICLKKEKKDGKLMKNYEYFAYY